MVSPYNMNQSIQKRGATFNNCDKCCVFLNRSNLCGCLTLLIIFGLMLLSFWVNTRIENNVSDNLIIIKDNINNDNLIGTSTGVNEGLKINITNVLDNKNDNIIVFIHMTDSHISVQDVKYEQNLELIVKDKISEMIKPNFVVHSGDIVHAKGNSDSFFGTTHQVESEWKTYKTLLEKYNLYDDKKWFDLKGNHDAFDVANNQDPNNFFKDYSVQGPSLRSTQQGKFGVYKPNNDYTLEELTDFNKSNDHLMPRYTDVYNMIHTTSFGVYQVIALDETRKPGITMPFNLFGEVSNETIHKLKSTLIATAPLVDYTILAGHFPLNFLSEGKDELIDLMKEYDVPYYLCGHTHRLNMLGRWDRIIEIETADVKHNQAFRVMAIDNGLLSFREVTIDEDPIVILLNPKDAKHLSDTEPLWLMEDSSHIRFLVWSKDSNTTSAKVTVDGKTICEQAEKVEGSVHPLYACEWDSSKYKTGIHEITITIDKEVVLSQTFSLDGEVDFLGANFSQIYQHVNSRALFMGLAITIWVLMFCCCLCCARLRTKQLDANDAYERWEAYIETLQSTEAKGIGIDYLTLVNKNHSMKKTIRNHEIRDRRGKHPVDLSDLDGSDYLDDSDNESMIAAIQKQTSIKFKVSNFGRTDDDPVLFCGERSRFGLYCTWKIELAIWRFSKLPYAGMWYIYGLWLLALPLVIGPILPNDEWGMIALFWSVNLKTGVSFSLPENGMLFFCIVFLWSTPLMWYVSTVGLKQSNLGRLCGNNEGVYYKRPGTTSLQGWILLIILVGVMCYIMAYMAVQLGVVTLLTSPVLGIHCLLTLFLIVKTIQKHRK